MYLSKSFKKIKLDFLWFEYHILFKFMLIYLIQHINIYLYSISSQSPYWLRFILNKFISIVKFQIESNRSSDVISDVKLEPNH